MMSPIAMIECTSTNLIILISFMRLGIESDLHATQFTGRKHAVQAPSTSNLIEFDIGFVKRKHTQQHIKMLFVLNAIGKVRFVAQIIRSSDLFGRTICNFWNNADKKNSTRG